MAKSLKRERSKNLTDETIKKIVELLDGWSGKLTWKKLIVEIELHFRTTYTRQTLSGHARV